MPEEEGKEQKSETKYLWVNGGVEKPDYVHGLDLFVKWS